MENLLIFRYNDCSDESRLLLNLILMWSILLITRLEYAIYFIFKRMGS